MKIEKKKILPSVIVTALYGAVMCGLGLFGEGAKSVVLTVAPYFFATIGFVLVCIIPYKVMEALERNKAIREKIAEERRIAAEIERNKRLKQQAKKYEQEMYNDMV